MREFKKEIKKKKKKTLSPWLYCQSLIALNVAYLGPENSLHHKTIKTNPKVSASISPEPKSPGYAQANWEKVHGLVLWVLVTTSWDRQINGQRDG